MITERSTKSWGVRLNRSEARLLPSGDLVAKKKSLEKFWALCVVGYSRLVLRLRIHVYSASGLRVAGSLTGPTLSLVSDKRGCLPLTAFRRASICGICPMFISFLEHRARRPLQSVWLARIYSCPPFPSLPASYMRRIVPSTPLEVLPGISSQAFLRRSSSSSFYCVTGIFSAPTKTNCATDPSETLELFPDQSFQPLMASCRRDVPAQTT